MSNLTFTGTVNKLKEVQIISDKFRKQEIILTDNHEKYPKFINFEATNDNCDLLAEIKEGQEVEVNFNLEGRLWTNPKTNEERCFNTLRIWKINIKGSAEQSAPAETKPNVTSDLPF